MGQDSKLSIVSAEPLKVVGSANLPWTETYPKTAAIVKGAVNTLPAVGGIVGGIVGTGTPAGPIWGAGLGAGVGKGARDLIAEKHRVFGHDIGLGLEPESSPLSKTGGILTDVALTAGTAKLMQHVGQFLDMMKDNPRATVGEFLDHVLHPLKTADAAVQAFKSGGAKAAVPSMGDAYASYADTPLYKIVEHISDAPDVAAKTFQTVARSQSVPAATTGTKGLQKMVTDIMDAATAPGSKAGISDFDSKFVESIGEQLKAGRSLSPKQSTLLYKLYSRVLHAAQP